MPTWTCVEAVLLDVIAEVVIILGVPAMGVLTMGWLAGAVKDDCLKDAGNAIGVIVRTR
jgi:hypothetical protein